MDKDTRNTSLFAGLMVIVLAELIETLLRDMGGSGQARELLIDLESRARFVLDRTPMDGVQEGDQVAIMDRASAWLASTFADLRQRLPLPGALPPSDVS